jgi:predicted 2-oxoglutarate/Fe(II)-dependent dioxygenase YbiX
MSYDPGKGGVSDAATAISITHHAVTGRGTWREKIGNEVVKAIGTTFDRYHERFSRREQGLNFLHIDKIVGLRLIRYETGQFMKIHTDKYPDAETGSLSWPAVTFTINLNDDFSGGELSLLDGELVIKVKAGQGIFFPSNFIFPHSVEKVTNGTRYALVGWFL